MIELLQILSFLIIPLALYGYGRFMLLQSHGFNHYNCGVYLAVGLSFMIFLCGYLEFFHMASPSFFNHFLSLGVIFLLVSIWKLHSINFSFEEIFLICLNIGNNFKKLKSGTIFFRLLPIILIFISFYYFYSRPLNIHDDFSGYLVLSKRIIQEGFQGGDFFNDRSIEQGFGAGNYIIAVVSLFLPINSVNLSDGGIGILILFLLLLGAFKNATAPKPPLIFLITLATGLIIIINAPMVNVSPLIIACGLFTATIFYFVESNFGEHYFNHILFALLLSSLLLLKGNYIIPVCAMSLCVYLSRFKIVGWRRSSLEFGIFLSCMLIFTMPWLIANFQFSKTPFYPLLGHGLVAPNALTLASLDQFTDAFFDLLPYQIILFGLLTFINRFHKGIDSQIYSFITSLSISIILLSCILCMTSAGSITRYSYVSLFGPMAFLILYILNNITTLSIFTTSRQNSINFLIFIFLVSISVPQLFNTAKRSYRNIVSVLFTSNDGRSHSFDYLKSKDRIELLQNSIPQGSIVLLRLDTPFLIDFRKHKYHVMDWPGNVGPAPGVPFDQSPEDLANYLRKQGITHVAYSYGNEALFSIKDPELSSRRNHPNPWIRTQALRTFAVQMQLEDLGYHYVRIFDNGKDFVIDLSQKNSLKVSN